MKRSIIKIVIGLLGFGILVLMIYLVLFSPQFANNVWVMKARYQYILMVDKIDLLKPTIRAVRVDDDNPDLYVYLLQGKIEKADPGGLYMRGRDGKIYGFLIKWDSVGEGWVRKVGTSTSDVKMKNWKRILMTFNIDDINKSGSTDDTEGGKYTPFEQD